MAAMKPTSGPWVAEPFHHGAQIKNPEGIAVAVVLTNNWADSKLIASAPEMRALLEQCANFIYEEISLFSEKRMALIRMYRALEDKLREK